MLRLRALTTSVAVLLLAGCAGGGSESVPVAGNATTGSTLAEQSAATAFGDGIVKHNTWKTLKPMPTARTGPGAGTIGTTIYVVGGFDGNNPLTVNQAYDTTKNTWKKVAPMPTARWIFSAAVVGKTFYAIGGELGGPGPGYHQTNVVEAYDSTKDTWTTKAPMPTVRNSTSTVVLGGDIYVVGGFASTSGERLATVERYSPATDTWKTETPMNVARSGVALGSVGTDIFAADGLSNSGVTTDNESYTSAGNAWATLASATIDQNSACAAGISQTLYVAGGADTRDDALPQTYAYDIAKNAWTRKASMPLAVVGAGSTVAQGKLFCIGGGNHGNVSGATIYDTVQAYRP